MGTKLRAARRPRKPREKGAVAVEFAIILPVFLVLVFGIMEFGRAFNIQVSLSEAARESARYVAVHCTEAGYDEADALAAAVSAAPSVPLSDADVDIQYSGDGTCAAGNNAEVTVTYTASYLTGLPGFIPGMPSDLEIESKGVMRCGG
ncbi:TadE/TadG family type IV pilus assembly protein [Arthrobacter sp. QXT-31]|uniref:TadE/TadG family type IV pilus assembly protein n=1 Tax=Arthrobacter sp. QXT-31 TaxID=1357915 RepID=UPI00097180A5|nr:TadE family protein [Arthrobacter sp. QXT-31]APX03146.1 pilus assembly protein TadE [Arthrobacter sp. QXT-31]